MKHTVGGLGGTEASRPHPDVESGLPPGSVLDLQGCWSLKEDYSTFYSTREVPPASFCCPTHPGGFLRKKGCGEEGRVRKKGEGRG